jgi:hypothetical protein
MALSAQSISRYPEFETVRVVTVGAPNPLFVHLALKKRAEDVDFVEDLSVGEVEVFTESL